MKGLYEAATCNEIQQRISRLRPDSGRLWGHMQPAQMLAHCSAGMRMASGEITAPRIFIGRLLGGLAKRQMIRKQRPMPRNAKADVRLIVSDERDFAVERDQLSGLINRFSAAGPEGCTKQPHFFFGPLTAPEWAALMYQHLDHHLRQFQV